MSDVREKILVVEDECILSEFIADFVRDFCTAGVITVRTNNQALAFLKHERPALAIVDYRVADGVISPTVRRLGELEVPFLVISGYSRDISEDATLRRAVWLEKPFSEAELAQNLTACIKGGCSASA